MISWISRFLRAVFGSRNDRLLKQYGRSVRAINALEPSMAALPDQALAAKTLELRERFAKRVEGVPEEGRDVAEKVHTEVRRLGGVRPPREFVFMDRAAIGLGSVFFHLKAEINWYRLFHELIADFDVKALHRRQTKALKAAGVPLPQ